MLTRRGSMVCVAAVALVVAGRLLGIRELYSVAVVGLALVGATLLYVRHHPSRIEATRELRPPQVHAGGTSRVELAIRNLDDRRSPVLSARDPFDGGRRWARFHVAPLEPGETVRAAYRLPTGERGVFPLGPLEVELQDPFGLARRTTVAAAEAVLTVYPHVTDIRPLPPSRGTEPTGSSGTQSLTPSGEDFFALRPYVPGDDIRRVHWAMTARHGDLMVRQDETPWQGRATVLADLRRSVHAAGSLEPALVAVASIVLASWRDRRQVRLVTTDGTDTGFGTGHRHLANLLELLAAAELHDGEADLAALIAGSEHRGAGGSTAVVTTDKVADADVLAVARLATGTSPAVLVLFEAPSWDERAAPRPPRPVPRHIVAVRVDASDGFAAAWDRVVPAYAGRGAATVGER